MIKLTGQEAIEAKRRDPAIVLCKYADPTEGERIDITAEEAIEIAKEDAGLIYAPLAGKSTLLREWARRNDMAFVDVPLPPNLADDQSVMSLRVKRAVKGRWDV